ncbi:MULTISPECIES: hypothetical protein [Parachlamydia]|uniref:Uncharacterized protein n=1 Tax=Parachlamydia acanthamoebae TaxID=83552 RepID=A0A0C1CCI8_9BACT|nr:hypothetical protein [Parachlamydia acanthamoebae]KIA78595.1 hypothetical protein DB43_DS00220 [Parachlamydia acanthamoebae]
MLIQYGFSPEPLSPLIFRPEKSPHPFTTMHLGSSPQYSVFQGEQLTRLQKIILENRVTIALNLPDKTFRHLKQEEISSFEHVEFPYYLFALPHRNWLPTILNSYNAFAYIIKEYKLTHCIIPHIQVVSLALLDPLEDSFLMIAEKPMELTFDPISSQQKIENIYANFSHSPTLKEKWHTIFNQMTEFLCHFPYLHVDWHHLGLTEEGFVFLDFRQAPPNDPQSYIFALLDLLKLAHLDFMASICQIAKTYDFYLPRDQINLLKLENQLLSKIRLKVSKLHQKNKIDFAQEIDEHQFLKGSLKRIIIENFNHALRKKHASSIYQKISLLDERTLSWFPFLAGIPIEEEGNLNTALDELCEADILYALFKKNEGKFDAHYLLFF